jgi:hypothetical protein
MRESPSGKASAFQADIRGSESRLPLKNKKTLQERSMSENYLGGFFLQTQTKRQQQWASAAVP